jgi:hypothetical protein
MYLAVYPSKSRIFSVRNNVVGSNDSRVSSQISDMRTRDISAELQEIWTNVDRTTDRLVGLMEHPRMSEIDRVRNQNRVILSKGQEVHNAAQDHLRNQPDGL